MYLRYKIKTPPAFSPVTVAQLKRNLRIEHSDQDELLTEIMDRAVSSSQIATGRCYARSTVTLFLDAYPKDDETEIDYGPVNAISSVKYYPPNSAPIATVDVAKYQLDNTELTSRLRFLESFEPDTEKMNVIEIEFTTGWGDAGIVPKDLIEAIILRASEAYLNPENASGSGKRITTAENKERNYSIPRY